MGVTLDDVAAIALGFPGVVEVVKRDQRAWAVGKQTVVWERPLTKADIKRFGSESIPQGPIVAVTTEDLHEKAAILAEGHAGFFDMEHFRGYPAFLIQLPLVHRRTLKTAIEDAWMACAATPVIEAYRSRSKP